MAAPPAREMRERKSGPPLLSAGPPEPAGKAKTRRPSKKKASTGKKAGTKSKAALAAVAGIKTGASSAALKSASGDVSEGVKDAVLVGQTDTGLIEMDEVEEGNEDQVFCTCLGRDDGRPMIECEGCENW